jgi:hypothetical protein
MSRSSSRDITVQRGFTGTSSRAIEAMSRRPEPWSGPALGTIGRPRRNQRIIAQMVDKASALFDHAIKKRQIAELLLTKLQEASAKAKRAL